MIRASWQAYTLHFRQPAGTSRGYLRRRETFFLRLEAEDGTTGWGECAPIPGLSPDHRPELAAMLDRLCAALNRGQPVTELTEPVEKLEEELGLAQWPALRFALETAWLDLARGGRQRLFDTPFTQGQAALPIHGLIWMDSPEGLLAQVDAKVAQGFRVIKMKVGALDFATERQVLAEIRRRHPAEEVELRLDANGAFSPEEALARLEALAPFQIRFLEQPIRPGQWRALAALCARSPVPIALDEELIGHVSEGERQALLAQIRPQHLVLKPTLLGGLAPAHSWIRLAQEQGIDWWINSALESNLGLSVLAQWTSHLEAGQALDPGQGRVHGLGTGRLFTNNLPGPIRLQGTGLVMEPGGEWDFSLVSG